MKQKLNVAIQTYNLEKERVCPNPSKLDICEGIHNDCLSCGENIQHPLCPNCIAKAFDQWIQKFPEHKKIKGELNTFMKHHNHIKGKSNSRVTCNGDVHICPYCFTNYLYKLIKEAGMGVRAMSEFLFLFNFDFNHKGYSKELRRALH